MAYPGYVRLSLTGCGQHLVPVVTWDIGNIVSMLGTYISPLTLYGTSQETQC